MTSYFADFAIHRFILLTTFRKSGKAVATPVWFVLENDRIYVQTESSTGKVKRLRNNPDVTVVPCNARGNVVEGFASLQAVGGFVTDPTELERSEELLAQKYGLFRSLFITVGGIMSRLRGKSRQFTYLVILPPQD